MLKTCRDHFDPQGQTYCVVGVYTVNAEHVRIGLQIHSLAKRGPLKSEALLGGSCVHTFEKQKNASDCLANRYCQEKCIIIQYKCNTKQTIS